MRFLIIPFLLFLGACTPAIKDSFASNWDTFKAYSFSDTASEFSGVPLIMESNGWETKKLSVAEPCQTTWEDRYIEINGYWHIERQPTRTCN